MVSSKLGRDLFGLRRWCAALHGEPNQLGQAPNLRSLSPAFVPDQHQDYVDILRAELTKSGTDIPRNVALTGHYGSGKSSVLVEVQRQLEASGLKVINLSLPSLGVGDGRIPKDGDLAFDKTNLIQKEIVKQLLYRRKPSDTPSSRFNRLDIFHRCRAYLRSGIASFAVIGMALLLKLPTNMRESLPLNAWQWLDDHLWRYTSGLIEWLSLLVVFLLAFTIATWCQRLLQQRFRISELVAGPAKVTLTESSSSYFDEYLDEIVYFFQTSGTVVAIFEDLDRFKDPHIFETLRELNLLLNNAEQTGAAPIRFVYAIRDSIFEQLDAGADEAEPERAAGLDDEIHGDSRDADADMGETRRLMSTNRTKFFDLVVPMVPFISHRTSRDLIRVELEAIDGSKHPGNRVIDTVGAHITDMRLIKNICNEYEVFRRRILTDEGLRELTADRLFASIVYKNLYLADYEKIRYGTSRLDLLYRAYRAWISHRTRVSRAAERLGRIRLRRIDGIASRAIDLGKRLQDILVAKQAQKINAQTITVSAGGVNYSWSDLQAGHFWQAYLRDRGDLQVTYPGTYPGQSALSFADVQTLLDRHLSAEDWDAEVRADVRDVIDKAVADRRSLAQTSMMTALSESDKLFPYRGGECSVLDVAKELFAGADLVLELLRSGFIDENFTLYITQFPGQAISASAMNFIIKAVQADAMFMEYHFGTAEEADAADIESVLDTEAERLFGGQSVYNIEIFDYLLACRSDRLDEPIRRLGLNAATDRAFLDAYLTSGRQAAELARRMSASWPGIFGYLLDQDSELDNGELLNSALLGVRSEVVYELSPRQRSAITSALMNLEVITATQTSGRSAEIAQVLSQMDVSIPDLSVVAAPLQAEVIAKSLYPVSLPNLRAIAENDDAKLCLDSLKDMHEADVYPHVLAHLPDYFTALDQATTVPSVARNEKFAGVLADVKDADAEAVSEVARKAHAQCMLRDGADLDSALWPSLAATHRLALTAKNVAAYIEAYGVDEHIADWLTAAGAIEVEDSDDTSLVSLALSVLNARTLDGHSRVAIVDSLHLDSGSVSAASLEASARSLLPALVKSGLVPDGPEAYNSLGDDDWSTREALISASKAFPEYMASLSLTATELYLIASGTAPDSVKDVILANLDSFEALGQKGAIALAAWAARMEKTPSADTIAALASKGGSATARSIISLLGAQASSIEGDSLKVALNALGRPYAQLTRAGRDRPKVPMSEGTEPILARLREEGIVSRYQPKPKRAEFEISKRHALAADGCGAGSNP